MATALKAPIDAPHATTSSACPPRSAWMAGTTSHRTASWNWLSTHIRCPGGPALVIMSCPATLSTEYSLTLPSASSGPHASISPNRSTSSASPPAVGNTSTGAPYEPHRTSVISRCSRSENHRSTAFTGPAGPASLVEVFLRARKNPRESFPHPVAPVLPAVAVPGLHIPHSHPGRLEHRDHGPVRHDQRLVDPARHEHPVRGPPRRGPVAVDEPYHRLECRPPAVIMADVGKDEGSRLQQQRPELGWVAVRGRQRGHRPEAGPHQAPRPRPGSERELLGQPRYQLGHQVPGVRRGVRVLGQPVPRVHEGRDELGHVQPVDEVVQHRLRGRVLQVVTAVVHDQQRIPPGPPEPGGQVERHLRVPSQRPARHRELSQRPGPRLGIGPRPVRDLVPARVADRRAAHRAVRDPRVQRIVEALPVVAADHLQLVLDPGPVRQLEHRVPQVGAAEPAQRQVVGQPERAVHDEHRVGLAAEQERAPRALHDRDLVPGQEPVDGDRQQRPPVPQPVDRQLPARRPPRHRPHAAPHAATTVTWPSSPSTRVPGGQLPLPSVSTRAPGSSSTQRSGANLLATTAIRGASSSRRRARACGKTTAPRTRLSPLPCTSGNPGPCGARSPNSTIRSASAIAPADHAMTGDRITAATLNRCSTCASTSTRPPASTTAAAPDSSASTAARCSAIAGRSCGLSCSKNSPRTSLTRTRCAASSSRTAATASASAAKASRSLPLLFAWTVYAAWSAWS